MVKLEEEESWRQVKRERAGDAAAGPSATTSGRGGDDGPPRAGLELLQAAERIQEEDSQGGGAETETDREAILVDLDESVLDKIKEETQCMICFQVIKNCRTVSQCLHRFCHECIEMALRVNSKECPLCKAKLPSRRSLREDPNFDRLVKAIYGDPEEHRAEELKTSDEWWSKNKGSFKHIGESYNKQKQATKGKRARTFAPKKTAAKARKQTASTGAGTPVLKRRGRPPKAPQQRHITGTQEDPTPAEVEASYAFIRSENKRESRDILDQVKQENSTRPDSHFLPYMPENILILLQPADDGSDLQKLKKPFLICNPKLRFDQLKKLVSYNLSKEMKSESSDDHVLMPAELHLGLVIEGDTGTFVVPVDDTGYIAETIGVAMFRTASFKGRKGLSVQYSKKPFLLTRG
jgi:hypothetical protein